MDGERARARLSTYFPPVPPIIDLNADPLALDVQRRWPEEKLPIELEPLRNFNVRAKVVGPGVSPSLSLFRGYSLRTHSRPFLLGPTRARSPRLASPSYPARPRL